MSEKLKNSRLLTGAAALFCCALWGISTPFVKMGYAYIDASHIPSLLLWAGLQFLIAGTMTVGVCSLVTRRFLRPRKGGVKKVALISLFQTVLQYTLLYIGMSRTTAVKGAILKSTDVFMVALMAGLVFRTEKLTARKILSCIIGLAGIVIMNLDGLSLNFSLAGDGVVLLAIVSYSVSVLLVKRFARDEDPIMLSGWQMALGGCAMLLIGAVSGGTMDFFGILPVMLILAAIYAASYTLWTVLLKFSDASKIIIFSFTTPVFGVLFSALLLREAGGVAPVPLAIALVMVCIGIVLGSVEKKPAAAVQE